MKKLPRTMGTIAVSQRKAIIMAIKENDDVEFVFNGKKFIITLNEAKRDIFKLIETSLKDLESIKNNMEKLINERTSMLKEEFETLKMVTNPTSIKMILNTSKEVIFEREDSSEPWFDNKCSNEDLLKYCQREGDTIQRVQWEDGKHMGSILHIYFQ